MKIASLFALTVFSTSAFAITDSQIRTAEDVRFCGGQKHNQNITPHSMADDGSVYRVGNKRWNDRYEEKFGKWVSDHVNKEIFKKFNIVTDCADAALAVRAIFARMHHLPVSFAGNHYRHTSKKYARYRTVKNWSPETWEQNLKDDTRFRKALDDWKLGTGTVNIHADTYQLRVRRESDSTRLSRYVRPGAVLLDHGHTRFVSQIDSLNWTPVTQLNSTVPAKVRTLSESGMSLGYPSQAQGARTGRGLLGWNWVINCGGKFNKVSDHKMPYYSPEQNRFKEIYGSKGFTAVIQDLARARMLKEPKRSDFNHLTSGLIDLITERVEAVELGYEAGLQNPTEIRNLEGSLYDTYSTPSRDKRIKAYLQNMIELLQKKGKDVGVDYHHLAKPLLNKTIQIGNGKRISYYHFAIALLDKEISSDPWDSLEKRWGIQTLKGRSLESKSILLKNKKELSDYNEKLKDLKDELTDHNEDARWYKDNSGWAYYLGLQKKFLRYSKEHKESSKKTAKYIDSVKEEISNTKGKIQFINSELEILSGH
jgi:hypothetical protein